MERFIVYGIAKQTLIIYGRTIRPGEHLAEIMTKEDCDFYTQFLGEVVTKPYFESEKDEGEEIREIVDSFGESTEKAEIKTRTPEKREAKGDKKHDRA